MPRIDWSNIEENKGAGGIQTLPSGAYVCAVTGASYETSKKGDPMLTLLFDIADAHTGDSSPVTSSPTSRSATATA